MTEHRSEPDATPGLAQPSPDLHPRARELYQLVEELYPICRSITGDGVRRTLAILGRYAQLEIHEVPSGSPVLDWTVPNEWNIRDAYIADTQGRRVVDFRTHNLHVLGYSTPIRRRVPRAELEKHLHSLPDQPDVIPYRTSYYAENWGFCLSHSQRQTLREDHYDVCIDSTLAPGHLTYGEVVLPGETREEILISAHVCHPSLADDNTSGLAIAALLARELSAQPSRRHTLRFVFAPGTIGAITWLARNREHACQHIRHGLTLTCLGDEHPFTYKATVFGATELDRVVAHVLQAGGYPHQIIDFFPYGYDERQYNSPGFRLPVGSLMRGRHGMFPQYHTSGDNLQFVAAKHLHTSFGLLREVIDTLDANRRFVNLQPYGEPQLGKRGLYQALGGTHIADLQLALLWVLNLSDGRHSLLDIAERSRMPFSTIRVAAELLAKHELLSDAALAVQNVRDAHKAHSAQHAGHAGHAEKDG